MRHFSNQVGNEIVITDENREKWSDWLDRLIIDDEHYNYFDLYAQELFITYIIEHFRSLN